MSRDPQNYSMAGRKAELTVFFSDVRGFTSISERLAPEQLAALMNDYLGVMTAIIRRHHGTLDKYIGDAIMAFWGAPMAEPAHARQAVRAALAMQAALPALNEKLKDKGWPELAIGMGINTGWVTVGDMGSPVRQSYTVLGDAVNLASRLEGATKQYGVGLIVGENTRAQLGDEFLCREIDRVRVKGKTEAITLYEPLAPADEATDELRRELAQWNEVLQAWRARRWEQALVLLDALEIQTPRPLYAIYRERIKAFIDQAPEADWAGVTSLHSK
jgi:adenylate cyclase